MGTHRINLDNIREGDKAILEINGREVEIEVRRVSDCFPRHVPIDTPFGPRPIGELRAGDLVYSWNGQESRVVCATITAVIRYAPSEIVHLSLEGLREPLETTMQHTFQTSRGPIRVAELNEQDMLRAPQTDLGWRRVRTVSVTGRKEPVYNLQTAHEHNFLVHGVVAEDFTVLRRLRTAWHRLFIDPRTAPCTAHS